MFKTSNKKGKKGIDILESLDIKISNEIQAPHSFFFTLLVMLGNYAPTKGGLP